MGSGNRSDVRCDAVRDALQGIFSCCVLNDCSSPYIVYMLRDSEIREDWATIMLAVKQIEETQRIHDGTTLQPLYLNILFIFLKQSGFAAVLTEAYAIGRCN